MSRLLPTVAAKSLRYRVQLGQRVVVIGGGFVAFDAARTALRDTLTDAAHEREELAAESDARVKEAFDSARLVVRAGARDVTVVALESFDEMPVLRTTQGHEEFEEAKREARRVVAALAPQRALDHCPALVGGQGLCSSSTTGTPGGCWVGTCSD